MRAIELPVTRPTITVLPRTDYTGSVSPDVLMDRLLSRHIEGSAPRLFMANFSFLKHINDTYGHKAGDAYLKWIAGIMDEVAARAGERGAVKARFGPNFAFELREGVAVSEVNALFREVAARSEMKHEGIRVNFDQRTGEMVIHAERSAERGTFREARRGNPPAWNIMEIAPKNNPSPSSRIEIGRAISENIYYLNAGEHVRGEFKVYAEEYRHSRLEERVVRNNVQVRHLPHFDVFNARVNQAISQMQNGGQGGGTIVFFDGNKTGAYRASYGLAGDLMIDSIFNVRYAEIAAEVFPRDFTFVRYGPGSEEFFVHGDVDKAKMKEYMRRFIEKLNEPFKVRMEAGELRRTEFGRRLLEGRVTGERPAEYHHRFSGGRNAMVVDVDINSPRGVRGEFRGASITAAYKQLSLYPGESPQDIFRQNMERLNAAGEEAKRMNASRGNLLVEVGANGEARIVGTDDRARAAEYYRTEHTAKLIEAFRSGARGLPAHSLGQIAHTLEIMPPEMLAQFSARDMKELGRLLGSAKRNCSAGFELRLSGWLNRLGMHAPNLQAIVIENARFERVAYRFGRETAEALRRTQQGFSTGFFEGRNGETIVRDLETFRRNGDARVFGEYGLSETPDFTRVRGRLQSAHNAHASRVDVRSSFAKLAQALGAAGVTGQALESAALTLEKNSAQYLQRFKAWLNTSEGKRFLADPANRQQVKQMLKGHGSGLVMGLATLMGAEKLAEVLEINDPVLRLAFVIGLSHTANYTTMKVFSDGGVQKAYEGYLATMRGALKSQPAALSLFRGAARSVGSFSLGLVRVFGEFAVISNTLSELGVRNETALFAGGFAAHTAARAAFDVAALRFGARSAGIRALTVAGRAFGAAATVAFAGDSVMGWVNGEYGTSVNERVMERLKDEGNYTPGISGTIERIFAPQIHGTRTAGGDHSEGVSSGYITRVVNSVLEDDRSVSLEIRTGLRDALAPHLGEEGAEAELRQMASPIRWGRVRAGAIKEVRGINRGYGETYEVETPNFVSEKKIAEYVVGLVSASGEDISFSDPRIVASVMERFRLDNEADYHGIVPRMSAMLFQAQAATLYFLDPSVYGRTEAEQAGNGRGMNDDIRSIFNADGTVKDGRFNSFVSWLRSGR